MNSLSELIPQLRPKAPAPIAVPMLVIDPQRYKAIMERYRQFVYQYNQQRPSGQLPIKYQTELIFSVILGFYAAQLKNQLQTAIAFDPPALPKVQLNSYSIAHHKKNDIPRLAISKRTVQRHIRRMLAAGILSHYEFNGSKKPIYAHIHPKILGWDQNNEDQISAWTTRCPDISDLEPLNKNKISTFDKFPITTEKSAVFPAPNALFWNPREVRTTTERASSMPEVSKKLHSQVMEPFVLAAALAAHHYDHYQPLPLTLFKREAAQGSLAPEVFKSLVIAEFLKRAAQLWKHTSPYMGNWLKAYNMLNDHFFLPEHGTHHKAYMVNKLETWSWMLSYAQRWFARTKRRVLYPAQYFDVYRTKAFEGGFWYCSNAYKRHLKKQHQRKQQYKHLKTQAKRRQQAHQLQQRAKILIHKYQQRLMSFKTFSEIIHQQFPKAFYQQIPELILQSYTTHTL